MSDSPTEMLNEHDHALLETITRIDDPKQLITLVREYWGDLDRADRTPRRYLYFHLGVMCGTVMRLLEERGNE